MLSLSSVSASVFVLVVGCVAAALLAGVGRAGAALGEPPAVTRRWMLATAAGLLAWLAATTSIAATGLLRDFSASPPPLMPLVGLSLGLTVLLVLSRFGGRLATGLGVAALVGYQVFRVPLELVLFMLHRDGAIPVQMTFEGLNFDVVSGLTAIPVAWLAARGRLPAWGLLLWNLLGFGLLLAIGAISFLSTPTAMRLFTNEPANTFVAGAPYVWLPTFLVPAALFGHVLVFRRLWSERRAGAGILRARPARG